MNPLSLARELEALAQTGLHFAQDPYDQERYVRVREIATELLASMSNRTPAEIHDWRRVECGYATPKVDVRAFILQGDEVLLIRENADEGRWTLPGGWADVNEPPSVSVVREVEEESGYVVRAVHLLAVLDRDTQGHPVPHPYHIYKLFFHCEITGGSPRPCAESSESGFFPIDSLPELSESRVLARQIRMCHEAVRSGPGPAIYD